MPLMKLFVPPPNRGCRPLKGKNPNFFHTHCTVFVLFAPLMKLFVPPPEGTCKGKGP